MTDHRSCTHNFKAVVKLSLKYSGLNRFLTHDLCDTSEVLYQLNYRVNWELVTL